jgi:hypothetical protein
MKNPELRQEGMLQVNNNTAPCWHPYCSYFCTCTDSDLQAAASTMLVEPAGLPTRKATGERSEALNHPFQES